MCGEISQQMDSATYDSALNLLYFKYGPDYEFHCFDSTINDSTWNNVPLNMESENLPSLGMDLRNFNDHASSSNDSGGLSPKDDSDSSTDPDTSGDVSPPIIFNSRPVSRGNITGRTTRQLLKNKCATVMRKRRGNLPKAVVMKLYQWLERNRYCAYPSEATKIEMARTMGITVKQVSNWFINARRRKLTALLAEEGKNATDYRITRKKKGSAINRSRKPKTRLSSYQSTASTSSDDPVPSEPMQTPPRPACPILSPPSSQSPPSCQTSPTHSCSTSPSIYESSTDESVFEFRPIVPTERTLDFESL